MLCCPSRGLSEALSRLCRERVSEANHRGDAFAFLPSEPESTVPESLLGNGNKAVEMARGAAPPPRAAVGVTVVHAATTHGDLDALD
jgi:hypothetical protein